MQADFKNIILAKQENNIMLILTVFTPAYNRANTLPRTYESLLEQDCKEFVWLIVDDGSTDNTRELVEQWQKLDSGFEIRYIYKENGGMHTAHNTAYENIDTELNVCIDSDDKLAKGTVRKILDKWVKVRDKGYAGIIGLNANLNTGEIIGKGFNENAEETTLTQYYAMGGFGDKKLVYRTDIINKYPPYPVFEGEKYVALAYKYRLIDQDYKLAVLDDVLCDVEYLTDGSTRNMFNQYINNPRGFAFWRKVCMQYPESKRRVFVDCVHYVSSSLISGDKEFVKESPKRLMTVLAIPFGIVLTAYIRIKVC
jgi:glycosyltransferase involved in cell wall biosynthesis